MDCPIEPFVPIFMLIKIQTAQQINYTKISNTSNSNEPAGI